MARSTTVCSVAECNRPCVAGGYCDRHYRRWRTYGDPVGFADPAATALAISKAAKLRFAAMPEDLKRAQRSKAAATIRARRPAVTCQRCGALITVIPHEASSRKYCSIKCAAMDRPKRPKRTYVCAHCGVQFSDKRNPYLMHFCSQMCRGLWQSALPYEAWKKKLSESKLKNNKTAGTSNGMYGVPPPHGKGQWIDTPSQGAVFMRSSWEVVTSRYLTSQGVTWLYEPKRFTLRNKTYVPDFYIPEWGCYWEIKGWFKEKDAVKIAEFRELYPEERLVVITRETYRAISKSVAELDSVARPPN